MASAEASIRLEITRQQRSITVTLEKLRGQREFVESLGRGLNRRLYINDWSHERIQEAESQLRAAGLALPAIAGSDLDRQGTVALPEPPQIVRPDAIASRLGPDAVHNGLLAEADPLPALELEDIAADGIVLVVRSGHTKRPVVSRAADLLRKSGARVLGTVLNRRRLEIPDFLYRRI